MKIGVRTASLGDDIRQVAPLAQRLGYQGVQLDIVSTQLDLTALSISGQREMRHILAGHDLGLLSLRMQLPPEGLINDAFHDRLLWSFEKAIAAAVGLSAGVLCIDMGRLPVFAEPRPAKKPIAAQQAGSIILPGQEFLAPDPTEPSNPSDRADPAEWHAIDSLLREIGQQADRTGTIVAWSTELSSFVSLKRAIESAACSWFGVDLDPVSILRDHWQLPRIIASVGPLVRHLRARDGIKGSPGRTQPAPLGQGTTNWRELLALLDEGGYSGAAIVDTVDLPDRVEQARRAITLFAAK